jgi:hypothetical protein
MAECSVLRTPVRKLIASPANLSNCTAHAVKLSIFLMVMTSFISNIARSYWAR